MSNCDTTGSLVTVFGANDEDQDSLLGWFEYCRRTKRTSPVGDENATEHWMWPVLCPVAVNVYVDWYTVESFTVFRVTLSTSKESPVRLDHCMFIGIRFVPLYLTLQVRLTFWPCSMQPSLTVMVGREAETYTRTWPQNPTKRERGFKRWPCLRLVTRGRGSKRVDDPRPSAKSPLSFAGERTRQQCKLHGIWSVDSQEIFNATRCHILRQKCTKFDFGQGSAPDSLGSLQRSPDPPAGFQRSTSKRREGKGRRGNRP